MTKIVELRQALGRAVDELPNFIDNAEEFTKRSAAIDELKGQIGRAEQARRMQAELAAPADAQAELTGPPPARFARRESAHGELLRSSSALGNRPVSYERSLQWAREDLSWQTDVNKHFRSLGDFLQAVAVHYDSRGANSDSRLVRAPSDAMITKRAGATGGSEVDPTGGGFLVQTDFATAIFMLAHDMGEILSRTGTLTISSGANSIKVPGVDETSRANGSRWGGVSSSWTAEGINPGTSKPKFRIVEFDLKKLMSLAYVTDELLQDAGALTQIYSQAFSEEIMFMTEDAVFEGSGAGQPLGVMNAPCLITVGKETGQAAGTVVKENVDKMWARLWARSMKNAVWYYNQDILPQLSALSQVVGTGGVPVFLPPGGLSGSPFGTLYGRPMIPTEYNNALGTAGDILLADYGQYNLADKGGVQTAQSMHVAFLTDEMVFRVTYRVDGKPMWSKDLTPFKGTVTKSPFVALANR